MQTSILLVVVVATAIFVVMRIRVLEEKLGMLRRAMDRQLGEQDVEFMVKTIRENTADALESRIELLEEQLRQASSVKNTAADTSIASGE